MSDLILVEGQACLDYIDKPIGVASRDDTSNTDITTIARDNKYAKYVKILPNNLLLQGAVYSGTKLIQMSHDTSKRIVGYVSKRYADGGLQVYFLGNESIEVATGFKSHTADTKMYSAWKYELDIGTNEPQRDSDSSIPNFPDYEDTNTVIIDTVAYCNMYYKDGITKFVPFDDVLDYTPTLRAGDYPFTHTWRYQNNDPLNSYLNVVTITDDVNNTLECGHGANIGCLYDESLLYNPLSLLGGLIYNYLTSLNVMQKAFFPLSFPTPSAMNNYVGSDAVYVENTNLVTIPYNIILTENLESAKNYLTNGTLPPDAFLYPLDWENLPRYDETVPTGDQPDDYPDDNNPDDDLRDFDPTPNETPTFTVNQLTNYNWYWLTVPQWADFISWFWNDIGDFSDFDDIIAKVKGLYNDVASAVIMCRYYPVDISWIGGLGTQSNIKLGMIEKAGAVDTISQANALRSVDIGHVHIGRKYKSFMDMSPYSQLSLYLPWHGFIDLDMNLFNGHDVYVKALYDYLSGTIQYYIFYDNEVLVNTILCKMAMDIPLTLQTKNDRDSAIFNNVSSTIGGLVGAGAGILSGNPIGMALGVTQGVGAFNSANASAPMRLMGNVGESGAYIGCQNCFVVVRRPTIQPSDGKKKDTEVDASIDRLTTWKKNVGMLCGYGYTLSSLSGKGFTVCHSPRINFTNTAPLQTEVDEIYNYLEKGVIL